MHSPRGRCRAAGVDDEVCFVTKPQLAKAQLARALAAGVPFAYYTADEVYGNSTELQSGDVALGHVGSWLAAKLVATVEASSLKSGTTRSGV